MKSISAPDVRWDVICSLQHSLRDLRPGSSVFDRMDAAIDLALNPRRTATSVGFLRRNVLRDARRILKRRDPPIHFSTLKVEIDRHLSAAVSHWDPRVIAEVRDLKSRIRQAVSRIDHGEECLDAMLAEEPVRITAERIGVPQRRVEYIRSMIRATAIRIVSA